MWLSSAASYDCNLSEIALISHDLAYYPLVALDKINEINDLEPSKQNNLISFPKPADILIYCRGKMDLLICHTLYFIQSLLQVQLHPTTDSVDSDKT